MGPAGPCGPRAPTKSIMQTSGRSEGSTLALGLQMGQLAHPARNTAVRASAPPLIIALRSIMFILPFWPADGPPATFDNPIRTQFWGRPILKRASLTPRNQPCSTRKSTRVRVRFRRAASLILSSGPCYPACREIPVDNQDLPLKATPHTAGCPPPFPRRVFDVPPRRRICRSHLIPQGSMARTG